MVIPCGIVAAKAAGAASSAGATALGLGMGKTDLDLTRDLFRLQMQQAKRLWTADWAEASVRHGEACLQSAQQHAEAQAMAAAAYHQAEKINGQAIQLARDQDSRSYEIAWRAEVRESLRDELGNQNNRFNIIMLCDTVCLGCVFTLVADGGLPVSSSLVMVHLYVFCLGLSIMLFSISLWLSIIVVRRLYEHTASTLERKLFSQSDDLQKAWKQQLDQDMPTGPVELFLVNQAYERWVTDHLDPIGKASIHMLSIGVVVMFITAGLFVHNLYLIEYNSPIVVPATFWSFVFITSATILFMKYTEDRKEKKKLGVYDNSWQDQSTIENGPFAKISKAAEKLFSTTAVHLASAERQEQLYRREQREMEYLPKTQSLHHRVDSLRNESKGRAKMRKAVLQLLTTAAEELDALPEELTSRLTKMIHDIDEADERTADLVGKPYEPMLEHQGSQADTSRLIQRRVGGGGGLTSPLLKPRTPMAEYPMDAQRMLLSLSSVRTKLGEIPITTLLRLQNLSDQPLRLKSGVQLKEGKFIKSLHATDPHQNPVCYQLYPSTDIPPRSEIVIAARSGGTGWVPTSGIEGHLVYTNREETWQMKIDFRSSLIGNVRRCQVQAMPADNGEAAMNDSSSFSDDDDDDDESEMNTLNGDNNTTEEYWKISKVELDRKANSEFLISMDVLHGANATKAAHEHRQSQIILKAGPLYRNRINFGLGLQWYRKWCMLTVSDLVTSPNPTSTKRSKIPLKSIIRIEKVTDMVKANVFEIHTNVPNRLPFRFSAASEVERNDWIQKISAASGIHVVSSSLMDNNDDGLSSTASMTSSMRNGVECIIEDDTTGGTQVIYGKTTTKTMTTTQVVYEEI